MKYFIPYWEDWVHKDFDPIKDTYGKGGFNNSLFAHELFNPPPYDGILVSLGMFKEKIRLSLEGGKPKIRGFSNIKEYLRLPKSFPVLGDCGAFTYVNEKEPKITVSQAVELYQKLGFDYGISVDHICSETITVEEKKKEKFKFTQEKKLKGGKVKISLSEEELEFRRELSLSNAYSFIKEAKGFTPVGAAQGYSIESYIKSVKELIKMGYKFIALGGLVPRKTEFIRELLRELYREVNLKEVRVHLLGVLRKELLKEMRKFKVYSFDSASFYRKAWLKAKENYLGIDLKWYSSIRIPDSKNQRLRRKVKDQKELEKASFLEKKILRNLREYDKGNLKDIESLLEEIIKYDKLFYREEFKEEKYYNYYKELLQTKIWKECPCPVCRSLGIDVVIFRGANRNKRRGFHNTFVFYSKMLKEINP